MKTFSLEELIAIINGRLEKVYINDEKAGTPGANPLIHAYNDGADMMAKYMKDWFIYYYETGEKL